MQLNDTAPIGQKPKKKNIFFLCHQPNKKTRKIKKCRTQNTKPTTQTDKKKKKCNKCMFAINRMKN